MIWIFYPADSSSADADVLRYQTRVYSMYMAERTFIRQLGWYRRSLLLSQTWDEGLFFLQRRNEYYETRQTMAELK